MTTRHHIMTLLLLSVGSSAAFAENGSEPSTTVQVTSAIMCEMSALGKVDGADRPQTVLLATDTQNIDLVTGTELKMKSSTGLTSFYVKINSGTTQLIIVDAKLHPLASTFIKSQVHIGPGLFAQLEGMNTPDGHVVLNCFGKK